MIFIANVDIYSNLCARNPQQTPRSLARFFDTDMPIKPRKLPVSDPVAPSLLADE